MTEKQIIGHLPLRKQKYLVGVIEGKSKVKAKRDAGYSENTSSANLETEDYKTAFQQLARKKISASAVLRRIREGMDATKVTYASIDGKLTDSKESIDFKERREYTQLAAQMADYYTPRQEMKQIRALDPESQLRILELASRLGAAELDYQQRKALDKSFVPLLPTTDEE